MNIEKNPQILHFEEVSILSGRLLLCPDGGMVDAEDSKSSSFNGVRVQVPLGAPEKTKNPYFNDRDFYIVSNGLVILERHMMIVSENLLFCLSPKFPPYFSTGRWMHSQKRYCCHSTWIIWRKLSDIPRDPIESRYLNI